MSRGRKSKKNHLLTALKQAILQQAIQGKLTADWRAENPDIEPASELLKRIKAEKQKLIDEKKTRKEKPLPAISAEEIPFDLPDGWVWCRLQSYLDVRDGTHNTPKYVEKGVPLVTSKNLYTGKLDLTNIKYISEHDHNEITKRSNVEINDILLAMIGSIGNPVIVDTNLIFSIKNVALIKYYIKNATSPIYIKCFLETETRKFIKEARGGVQPFISLTKLRNTLFPLPPLPEQTAIVQKAEALMQKCDALEKGESIQHYPAINEPADQLLNRYAVGRQLLAELPQQQAQVKQLKQAILQDAIQGKLTADWRAENPDAESASELLKRIKAEKQKLIDEKKIRKEKPLPPISEEEIPFDLPVGWVWCRLGEVTFYGASEKVESSDLDFDTWVLDLEDIEKESSKIIQYKTFKERPSLSTKSKFQAGWVLYSKLRPYLDKVVVVEKKGVCTTEILPLPVFGGMVSRFMMYCMKSKEFLAYANSKVSGMKMPRLKTDDGRNALISLAPLPEQTAIVQKIESLMQTCTDLETQIKQSETHATQLMQAVIKEAFETEKTSAMP